MKLTRADKNFLITKVLTETFKAKFDAWEIDLKERIHAKVFLKHPVFERLLKDKDYLPAVEKVGLPAIIHATVRAELSNLGIPAK